MMIESLWLQTSLFPRQVWQFLKALAQKILALILAVLMPLVLGLIAVEAKQKNQPDLMGNLLYVALPSEGYVEVRQPEASDRRGLMTERWQGQEQVSLLFEPVQNMEQQTTLPPELMWQLQATAWSYQTLLADAWLLN